MSQAHLKVLQGPAEGRELQLESERYVIGRRPGSDLQLLDPGVSGQHCELVRSSDGWLVRDLGSYNGTFVNGKQVAELHLSDRDLILIGQSALQYIGGHASSSTRIVDDEWNRRESDIVEQMGTRESLAAVVGAETTIIDIRDLQRALRTVYEVSLQLARPWSDDPLAVDARLDEMLHTILESYRADRACLVLADQDGRRRVAATASRVGVELNVSRTILDSCIGQGASVLTLEPAADIYRQSESLGAQMVLSILCVPLVAADHILGALYVDSLTRIAAFTHDDMRVLRCVAHLVGEALERHRLQREAETARRQLLTVLEHAPVGVFALDRDARFSFWGRRMTRMTGRERGQVVGVAGLDVLLEDPRRAELIRQTLTDTGAFDGEVRVRGREGVLRAQLSLVRLDRPAGTVETIGSLLDMSEAERLKSQLLLRQKLAAVGLLVAGVCHDLRNFVAALYGRAQLAEQMPEQREALVATTLETCEDARQLVDALLDVVRGHDDSWEELDISELVRGVLRLIDAQMRVHRIEVRLALGATPPVRGIRSLLKDVLLNLVLNAQQAMANGGTLSIGSREVGEHVVVTVSDTGPGIPADVMPTLFEPLATGRGGEGGTGLGLYMVAQLVEQHGGHVEANSSPHGTQFRITLPIAQSHRVGMSTRPVRQLTQASDAPLLVAAAGEGIFVTLIPMVGDREIRRCRNTDELYAALVDGDRYAGMVIEGDLPGQMAIGDVLHLAGSMLPAGAPLIVVGGDQKLGRTPGAFWIAGPVHPPALRGALRNLQSGETDLDSTQRLPVHRSEDPAE